VTGGDALFGNFARVIFIRDFLKTASPTVIRHLKQCDKNASAGNHTAAHSVLLPFACKLPIFCGAVLWHKLPWKGAREGHE
jgi:hypothetical protein